MPNLLSLTTSCVCPELRPLPSTGITRFQRYCEPLRHPRAAGPSLTGVRLIIAEPASGLPVLRALPLCTCCRHYPGAAAGCIVCSLPQPCQPSPIWQSGRPAHRPFRGLLGVHSRYGLHTHAATNSWHASPKASTVSLPPQLLRLLPAGAVAGWGFHPLGKRRLITAHANCGHLTR